MNSAIEHLNHWGDSFLSFAWPMLWQSSLLIIVLLSMDVLFRRKIRASVRYALWLIVLVKLCLPPALALPTGAAWWLFPKKAVNRVVPVQKYVVAYDSTAPVADSVFESVQMLPPAPPRLDRFAWSLLGSGLVSCGLLLWLGIRWWQISQRIRRTELSKEFTRLLEETRCRVGLRGPLRLKLAEGRMSPAVCGLFRPVILLPRVLAEELAGEPLRAVLLHEAFHLRRRDVWVNCAQALVQIVYWWHPLLWLANARIRRLREEAVDDAVMLALHGGSDRYARTLLAVAKLVFRRPLMSLGLVGIMESRSALQKRIERLLNFSAPRKAGLTLTSLVGIMSFAAVAVPMGEAPSAASPAEQLDPTEVTATEQQSLTLHVDPEIFIRNVKSQAPKCFLSPTNDYTAILLDLLRSECVDCTPPHGIAFNTWTGEITTQNTPEKLEVFRRVIERLNRADGICELPLGNNPLRKNVLIEARLYQMTDADFGNYVSGLQFYRSRRGDDAWWSASPGQFKELIDALESSGLQLIQRPRILTGSGIEADFFVGNGTNSVQFDCKPHVESGSIDLSLRSAVAGVGASGSAFTNHFMVNASALTGGGIVVRVKNYGGEADNNLAVFIGMQLDTNIVHSEEQLSRILRPKNDAADESHGGQHQIGPKGETAVAPTKFVERMNATIGAGQLPPETAETRTFKLNQTVANDRLKQLLLEAGVRIPPTVFFYENNGILSVHGSRQQLEVVNRMVARLNGFSAKAADVNDGKPAGSTRGTDFEESGKTDLFARTFKVDTRAFVESLHNIPDLQSGSISLMARSLFSKFGVNWKSPAGKSVFYNDHLGVLFVKATQTDLDNIEQVVQALDYRPAQVHIKARFLEVPKGTLEGFGKMVGGTNQPDQLVGIMTAENAKTALRSLQSRPGVEELAAPEVTTLSGRQTEMRATQSMTIITNFTFVETNSAVAIIPQTNSVETGPILDTIAGVLPDDYTIDLKTAASVVGFLGYDKPTSPAVAYTSSGQKVSLPTISPGFCIRKAGADVKLWDGQTVVLGLNKHFYENGKEVSTEPDYFANAKAERNQPDETKKEVLVFVTVTLIDPVGNRIHSDSDMAFARNSVPQQNGP